jgi:CheY-like chemotaxis protein
LPTDRQVKTCLKTRGPMFVQDSTTELWTEGNVKCVLVPHGPNADVELRNAAGSAFLRKTAPSRQAGVNEAEYLRLRLRAKERALPERELKPFALVIEDDRDNCDALRQALRISGMRALGCRSGAEGLCLAHELVPDLVVLDYRLPDVTGAEICRRLRDDPETAATPIIAVTAAPEALRAAGCQADAVLAKPCELDTLLAAARLFVRHLAGRPDAAL